MKSRCYLCTASPTDTGLSTGLLCGGCLRQITWVDPGSMEFMLAAPGPECRSFRAPVFCRRCGGEYFFSEPTAGPERGLAFCPSCLDSREQQQPRFQLTHNTPLAYYQGLFAELLQWYKFSQELPLARFFAALVQFRYSRQFAGYYLVPVPPRPARLKQQAWDQVDYLCRILERYFRLPVLRLLQRNAGPQQKRRSRAERMKQLDSLDHYSLELSARCRAYRARQRHGPLRLLLFDDVYTTGTTMDLCHRALDPLKEMGWVADLRSLSLSLVP